MSIATFNDKNYRINSGRYIDKNISEFNDK